ncbi:MAG: DUF1232 domain-containing protein [Candidatus Kapabacteria bacterium]|nr:DUF1232 domain-containing protein [Ignavibacteriota bacterium]MCW5885245.1 DUF1232 domain-containing protein [Candidatus Kapabacteria bacterium]
MKDDFSKYSNKYDENKLFTKIRKYADGLGGGFLNKLLALWFALRDKDTPTWAKTIILGSLGYFIFPLDAIPDVLPVIGFSDDLTALISATAMIWAHIKPEHNHKAGEIIKKIFKKK